ncbi:MAG: protein kinase domain-containing protein [Planctomycetota bacterium]
MRLRTGSRIGKYKLTKLLGEGGFGRVYAARDEIENRAVALKVLPNVSGDPLRTTEFLREVRLTVGLDHPNILPIHNADIVDGCAVAAMPLGAESLAERMQRRLPARSAARFALQLLEGLAHAHEHRVLHLDVKPDNCILMQDGRLCIADFGLAKSGALTMPASGSGTLGYLPPEQAMGKPSRRSDVFAAGLVIWRMFTGRLPDWPFARPLPGHERARKALSKEALAILDRALQVEARKRFNGAPAMLDAWKRLGPRVLRQDTTRRRKGATGRRAKGDWRALRHRQFRRIFGRALRLGFECAKCGGPVAEAMNGCPWCGRTWKTHRAETDAPARCRRCKRGMKLDWSYCPWCWGAAVGPKSDREYSDRRYSAKCANRGCERRHLMPWMRYCPWCHTKVKRPWREQLPGQCRKCRWGVDTEHWSHCPWCTTKLR